MLFSISTYSVVIDVAVAETGGRTFPHRELSFAEAGMTLVRTHVSESGMRSTIMRSKYGLTVIARIRKLF